MQMWKIQKFHVLGVSLRALLRGPQCCYSYVPKLRSTQWAGHVDPQCLIPHFYVCMFKNVMHKLQLVTCMVDIAPGGCADPVTGIHSKQSAERG